MSYYGKSDDSSLGALFPIMMLAAVLPLVFYYTAYRLPVVRFLVLSCLLIIFVVQNLITLRFHAIAELVDLWQMMGEVARNGHLINTKTAWTAMASISSPPWLVGVIASVPGIYLCWKVFQDNRLESGMSFVKAQRRRSLEDLAKEWDIPVEIFQHDDPEKIAEEFAKVREKRNIPPSIFARKLEGDKRLAVSYFNRLLEHGEVMVKISDPDELRQFRKKQLEDFLNYGTGKEPPSPRAK